MTVSTVEKCNVYTRNVTVNRYFEDVELFLTTARRSAFNFGLKKVFFFRPRNSEKGCGGGPHMSVIRDNFIGSLLICSM